MEKRILRLALEALENRLAEVLLEREAIGIILKEEMEKERIHPVAGKPLRGAGSPRQSRAEKPKHHR